jgi:hypothetical protein
MGRLKPFYYQYESHNIMLYTLSIHNKFDLRNIVAYIIFLVLSNVLHSLSSMLKIPYP